MSTNVAIRVEHLCKSYKLYEAPADRLKEALNPFRKKYHRDFHALRDISFEVKKGETVGIIGQNGAGKSTLLKIITGVLTPTSGNVEVKGRISALLELGAGFNPDVTGLENVYYNGAVMGFTRSQMDAKIDDILAFADIGDFIHHPVKIYSSGMFIRLAFSVAVHVDPEILIVDEALSVGDIMFQSKCFEKIKSLMEGGATTLFVTHNVNTINTFCNRALMLESGKIFCQGKPQVVSLQYYQWIREKEHLSQTLKTVTADEGKADAISESRRTMNLIKEKSSELDFQYGTGTAGIDGCFVTNSAEEETSLLKCGEAFKVVLQVTFRERVENPCYGFSVSTQTGINLLSSHTYHDGTITFDAREKGDQVEVELQSSMLLNPGKYLLSVGVGEHRTPTDFTNFDVRKNVCEIEVYGKASFHGLIHHESTVTVSGKRI